MNKLKTFIFTASAVLSVNAFAQFGVYQPYADPFATAKISRL